MTGYKRLLQERAIAAGLTSALLLSFWLVAQVVNFTSSAPHARTLPIESGFEEAAAVTSRAAVPSTSQPDVSPLRRAKISLPEVDRAPSQPLNLRRETAEPRLRLEAVALGSPHDSKAVQSRVPLPLAARKSHTPAGPVLEWAQPAALTKDNKPPVRTDLPGIDKRPESVPVAPRPQDIQPPQAAVDHIDVGGIIEWMRRHAAELPPGIKRHVDYRPGNLTAVTSIAHEDARWAVYLLVRVPVRELHVVMVLGDDTYYLIDRSFQREGRSFRAGYARRERGVITGVISEERAASSAAAVRFYEVFLAWWDQERRKL